MICLTVRVACIHLLKKQVLVRPKKNNCVVRVTAEKTLGRVGRYFYFFFFFFFFFFFAMAHMLDDKKRLSS